MPCLLLKGFPDDPLLISIWQFLLLIQIEEAELLFDALRGIAFFRGSRGKGFRLGRHPFDMDDLIPVDIPQLLQGARRNELVADDALYVISFLVSQAGAGRLFNGAQRRLPHPSNAPFSIL